MWDGRHDVPRPENRIPDRIERVARLRALAAARAQRARDLAQTASVDGSKKFHLPDAIAPPTTTAFVVKEFNPMSGPPGTVVEIKGENFSYVNTVRFGGVAAEFALVDSQTIDAIVPAGATTGLISVTQNQGTVTSTLIFHVQVQLEGRSIVPEGEPWLAGADPVEFPERTGEGGPSRVIDPYGKPGVDSRGVKLDALGRTVTGGWDTDPMLSADERRMLSEAERRGEKLPGESPDKFPTMPRISDRGIPGVEPRWPEGVNHGVPGDPFGYDPLPGEKLTKNELRKSKEDLAAEASQMGHMTPVERQAAIDALASSTLTHAQRKVPGAKSAAIRAAQAAAERAAGHVMTPSERIAARAAGQLPGDPQANVPSVVLDGRPRRPRTDLSNWYSKDTTDWQFANPLTPAETAAKEEAKARGTSTMTPAEQEAEAKARAAAKGVPYDPTFAYPPVVIDSKTGQPRADTTDWYHDEPMTAAEKAASKSEQLDWQDESHLTKAEKAAKRKAEAKALKAMTPAERKAAKAAKLAAKKAAKSGKRTAHDPFGYDDTCG